MANFAYKAMSKAGEIVSGEMQGVSEDAIVEALKKLDLSPYHIEEMIGDSVAKKRAAKINVSLFTRQLYVLVRSGIPISKALKSLETSSSHLEMRDLFKDIRTSLDNGYELNVALQKHPDIFNKFYISMVKVGEFTGRLEEVLSELYTFLEFEQEIKTRAKTALRYPMFVFGVMILAFIVMMAFVVPTFGEIYKGFGAELPWPTRVLIGTSNFMVNYGVLLALLFGGGIHMFLSYIKTEAGSYWWSHFKFTIPIVGIIIKKSVLARFTKGFSLSLKSGVPVVQSLSTVQNIMENPYFEKHIEDIKHSIEKGNPLYNSMKNTGIFEPLVLEMFSTGEEAGELETMCDEVSFLYDQEISNELKNLSSYIEPIMLLIMGVLLLILALGIFLPIWDLGSVVIKE